MWRPVKPTSGPRRIHCGTKKPICRLRSTTVVTVASRRWFTLTRKAIERNRNDVGDALRHDGHQGQQSVRARSGWCGGASGRRDRGDPSGVLRRTRRVHCQLFAQWIAPEFEYTVVDITEILRLMRHTDSGE